LQYSVDRSGLAAFHALQLQAILLRGRPGAICSRPLQDAPLCCESQASRENPVLRGLPRAIEDGHHPAWMSTHKEQDGSAMVLAVREDVELKSV